MKIVGLTGGIGSGKSTIARMFADLGIPVYTADQEAKQLMNSDPLIRNQIIELLGEEAYDNQIIDRKFIASQVFSNPGLLKKLNAIVHPAVKVHFEQWVTQQNSAYIIKEVAILFENGGHKDCDLTILVTAPEEVRIQRVMKRDEATRKEVEDRIKNQWPDEEKIKLADYVVINMNLEKTLEEIKKIHKKILQ